MENQSHETKLSSEQKVGFYLLLVFAVLTVGLGILQFRNILYSPFAIEEDTTQTTNQGILLTDEAVRLQNIDTDKDGLNDFEELDFYQTSPYLPDTDSDGISDKAEIDAGTDPLCPEGDVCATPDSLPTTQTTTTIVSPANPGGGIEPEVPEQAFDILGQDDELGIQLDSATIRSLLLQSGDVTEEQLADISDEELFELINASLADPAVQEILQQ